MQRLFFFILPPLVGVYSQLNNNLEQQATLLFRSMFVDFSSSDRTDLVKTKFGAIPSSYSIVKNGELPIEVTDYVANGSFASLKANVTLYQQRNYAYFIRNTDLKTGTFEVFVDKHSYDFLAKSRLFGGEIIISNVGDVGSVFLCPKLDQPMTLGNNIIMIRPKKEELQYYLYVWFKWSYGQALIQAIKGGSAQPKFNKTDFKSLDIIIPTDADLCRYHELAKPLFDMIASNDAEIKKLIQMRDALLPKLMSGDLDISSVKI